jgi:hypothetical protein
MKNFLLKAGIVLLLLVAIILLFAPVFAQSQAITASNWYQRPFPKKDVVTASAYKIVDTTSNWRTPNSPVNTGIYDGVTIKHDNNGNVISVNKPGILTSDGTYSVPTNSFMGGGYIEETTSTSTYSSSSEESIQTVNGKVVSHKKVKTKPKISATIKIISK